MPLSKDAKSILRKFESEYGAKKGKSIYYATAKSQGRSERTFRRASKSTKK